MIVWFSDSELYYVFKQIKWPKRSQFLYIRHVPLPSFLSKISYAVHCILYITVCNTLYILNSKILFFCFKVYILLDGWGLLDTFRVGNSHSQFIQYILVETYHYYINRISTEFWYTQCQTMLQFDFLNFLGSNYLWSFCYIFLLCLSIYNYMNVVIVYLLAVFGSGKTFEYCYYLLEPC